MHTNAVRLLILIPENTLLVNLHSILLKTTTYTVIPVYLFNFHRGPFSISFRWSQGDGGGGDRLAAKRAGSSPTYVLQMK